MELNRIELHTIVYMGKEMNSYLKNINKNEDEASDESDDPYDKLIRESLYGAHEETPSLPTGYKGRVRLDPRDIEMENETFSLEQTQSSTPMFDNVELVLKSGETIVITESMDEYLKIRQEYFQWEKIVLNAQEAEKKMNTMTGWGSPSLSINGKPLQFYTDNGDSCTGHTEGI